MAKKKKKPLYRTYEVTVRMQEDLGVHEVREYISEAIHTHCGVFQPDYIKSYRALKPTVRIVPETSINKKAATPILRNRPVPTTSWSGLYGEEYMNKADNFDRNYQELIETLDDGKMRLLHAVIGMSGEVGELTDAVKKYAFYNKKDLDFGNVLEECGDILWYMHLALKQCGLTFKMAMEHNIAKLTKRYPKGFNYLDAVARKDKQ